MPDLFDPKPLDDIWPLLWEGLGFVGDAPPLGEGDCGMNGLDILYRVGRERAACVSYFSEAETGNTAAVGVRTARFIESPPDPLVEGMTALPGGHALLRSEMLYSVDSAIYLAAALQAVLRQAGHPITVLLPADSPETDA